MAKLAPDSVDASKIKPGAVGASELAGDAVETAKVKNGAITNAKIQTDTIDKTRLAALSVGGAEIIPLNVSAVHLSADAVETAKIKDGNVTHDKIADNAIEADKIKDGEVKVAELATDAVETLKIKDRNVTTAKIALLGVTPAELAADAVETLKIKDANVTGDKIALQNVSAAHMTDQMLMHFLTARPNFYDNFVGAVLDDRWAQAGDAGGGVLLNAFKLDVFTNNVTGESYRIDFNGNYIRSLTTTKPKIAFVILPSSANGEFFLALYRNADNFVAFYLDPSVSGNWKGITRVGGVSTEIDLGVTGFSHILLIDYVSNGEVKFYIDGALEGTSNTNIPDRWYLWL